MKVQLLYSGNAWLEHSSLQLLAVCTSFEKACELAQLHSNEGKYPMDESDADELKENGATYGREENYLICDAETDVLEG